jgi:hypothetical protein
MNRYFMIRRLRGPVFLLLVGVMALLAEMHILGWGRSWPLFLITAGVFLLAERAALANEEIYPPVPFPGAAGAAQSAEQPSTAIVPAHEAEFGNSGNNHEGGQQ